jgi:N4-(beta-N-acetylglucosaminyl)-L-asparaginase
MPYRTTRRRFLGQSLLGGLAAVSSTSSLLDVEMGLSSEAQSHFNATKNKGTLVIATWDNRKATAAAGAVLAEGGYVLDAIEAGIRIPEADPEDMSVGYGGHPDRDGNVTLDACIMDEKGRAGGVAFLQHIMHPISVARLVMEKTPHVLIVGDGAYDFARKEGFEHENLLTPAAEAAWRNWLITAEYAPKVNWEQHDTIGLVAMDKQGRIAGGCSTSGLGYKMRGRVGDSPIIGAGLFSDNEVGAASCTGLGEIVLRTLGSFLVVEEMRRGKHPQKAIEVALKRIIKKYPEAAATNQVGFVALDRKGRIGALALQKGFAYALYRDGQNTTHEAGWLL